MALHDVVFKCYNEAIRWTRNLFKIPSGKSGTMFVKELVRLIRAYVEGSSMESFALSAAMLMPILLLQKPHRKSKTKEHSTILLRRLDLWGKGKFDELMAESRQIQKCLSRGRTKWGKVSDRKALCFANLVMQGKLKAALAFLNNNCSNTGPLPLTDFIDENDHSLGTVCDVLLSKHPAGQPCVSSALVNPDPIPDDHCPHFIFLNRLDSAHIQRIVLKMDGGAGPSGVDAAGWRRLCTAFKKSSADLCDAIALLARRLGTSYLDPSGIQAFVACRLVALDKCPGVRPIGIGEVLRRIVGKAVLSILKEEIMEATGVLQLCAGQEAGCEVAVHALREVFNSSDSEAILLVDASNAFNSLNRKMALRNIRHLCLL